MIYPNSIFFDTASYNAGIAVTDSEGRAFKEFRLGGFRTDSLVDELDNLLGQAKMKLGEIHHCFVNVGPGGLTGIKTGIAFAQGLCSAGDQSPQLRYLSSLDLMRWSTNCSEDVMSPAVVVQISPNSYFGEYSPGPGILPEYLWSEEECRRELETLTTFIGMTVIIEERVADTLGVTQRVFRFPSVLDLMIAHDYVPPINNSPTRFLTTDFR